MRRLRQNREIGKEEEYSASCGSWHSHTRSGTSYFERLGLAGKVERSFEIVHFAGIEGPYEFMPVMFASGLGVRKIWPNKAPEPTPGTVTPRAIASVFEVKPQNPIRSVARGAPAPVVAHL